MYAESRLRTGAHDVTLCGTVATNICGGIGKNTRITVCLSSNRDPRRPWLAVLVGRCHRGTTAILTSQPLHPPSKILAQEASLLAHTRFLFLQEAGLPLLLSRLVMPLQQRSKRFFFRTTKTARVSSKFPASHNHKAVGPPFGPPCLRDSWAVFRKSRA